MKYPPKPNNNNLFSLLTAREQGDRRIQKRGSSIISDVTSRVAAMSQAAFDSAIEAARDRDGNAKLDFQIYIHNLSKITFKPGVKYNESRFIGATFPDNANLKGLNFQKADFSHAKLRQANLSGADLSGAILYEADLSGANLSMTELNGANLKGANLTGSSLSFAELNGANLSGVNLSGINLTRAKFLNTNLSGADLSGARIAGADFSGANLSGANFSRAAIVGPDFSGANLKGANLSGANLYLTKFNGADLSGVNLSGLDLIEAKFLNANLSGADLTNAKIAKADFSEADLSGADFSGTLKASITDNSRSDISATNVSKILDKLGDAQIEKMLGIGDEVTVKQYLENLITIPEVKNNEKTIDNIKKVIAVIASFEERIQSTTPSPNTQPSVGGKRKREESLEEGGSARKH